VEEFMLWEMERVAHTIAHTDEYKPNCGVVVMDFLVGIQDSRVIIEWGPGRRLEAKNAFFGAPRGTTGLTFALPAPPALFALAAARRRRGRPRWACGGMGRNTHCLLLIAPQVRHGYITPDMPGYTRLVAGMREGGPC
jgi:hypothetical protein